MCHVGTVQRLQGGKVQKEWTVARYGIMEAFGVHLGRTGLAMGVEKAKRLIFLSDGLRANWQICLDHFPWALQILDFYHASEHLREFCNLYKNPEKGAAALRAVVSDVLERGSVASDCGDENRYQRAFLQR